MTFCLGMKVREGLVGIADTRVTSGSECIVARKITTYQKEGQVMFLMTSGLRSVRDKTLTYFEEVWEERAEEFDRTFKAVNAIAEMLRRVAREDKEALAESGLPFNMHTIVGGQMRNDREHKFYMLYPQGNWVEVGVGTPYYIIGATGYGKPVLDRTLTYEDSMRHALKVGSLAFDSTRISAADVDFPMDVILYQRDSFQLIEHRFDKTDLADKSAWWQERLRKSINELPSEWMEDAFVKLSRQSLPEEIDA
ncbi:MAG: peptidase [Kiritimatiellae bacterium]|nr:peptidase [Kiritimatiellia bacterium]